MLLENKEADASMLNELVSNDPTVNAVARLMATRKRTRNGTVKSMRVEIRKHLGLRLTVNEVCEAIQKLERIGYAVLRLNREREMSIIEWRKGVEELQRDMKSEEKHSARPHNGFSSTSATDVDVNTQDLTHTNAVASGSYTDEQPRLLQREGKVLLSLPNDLSVAAATRIEAFARELVAEEFRRKGGSLGYPSMLVSH